MSVRDQLAYISNCSSGWGLVSSDDALSILQALDTLNSCVAALQAGNDVMVSLLQSLSQHLDNGAADVVGSVSFR